MRFLASKYFSFFSTFMYFCLEALLCTFRGFCHCRLKTQEENLEGLQSKTCSYRCMQELLKNRLYKCFGQGYIIFFNQQVFYLTLGPCKYIKEGQTCQASGMVFSVQARVLLKKEVRFLCVFRSDNKSIILHRVQQLAVKSSH